MYKSRIRRPPFPAFRLFTLRGLWGLSRFPPCRRPSGCFTTADSKTEAPPYIPLRKSVPPQRAAPTAAIPRGTAPDTASAPRLLPPEKAKAPPEPRENVKAPANKTARAVPGRGTVPAALDKEAARAPGREEEPDRAGQPDNTAHAKNGLVPAGYQAVPGESSKKCLSFSKAA